MKVSFSWKKVSNVTLAGHPDVSLCSWADGVLLVFSLADEESFRLVTDYSRRFSHLRPNLPLFLIGTQDALGARSPRVIDDSRARKLAHDLNGEYIETCATYGMNVDKAFVDAADRILKSKNYHSGQNSVKLAPNPNVGGQNKSRLSTTPLRTQAHNSRLQVSLVSTSVVHRNLASYCWFGRIVRRILKHPSGRPA